MLKSSTDSSDPRPDSKVSQQPPPTISRRQFSRKAALAAAGSISATALLGATSALSAPVQDQKDEPLKGLTAQQIAEVDAKLANILRKYGDRFSDDQKKRLRRILAQHQRLMAPVRVFAVQNGDPPASVLRVSFDRLSELKEGSGD